MKNLRLLLNSNLERAQDSRPGQRPGSTAQYRLKALKGRNSSSAWARIIPASLCRHYRVLGFKGGDIKGGAWHCLGLLFAGLSGLMTALAVGAFLLVPVVVQAQPSSANSISFQGVLNGADGKPLPDNAYNLTFRFWDGPAPGGNPVSTNIPLPNIQVLNGIVSTAIPVDAAWFNGQTRYLGITINSGKELLPRVLITAVPYALYCMSNGGLAVGSSGVVNIGSPQTPATVSIIHANGDPGAGGNLYLEGDNNDGDLLLGVNDGGSFIQSGASLPLAINPIGNNVGIGNGWPHNRLVVGTTHGDATVMPKCHETMVIGSREIAGGMKIGLYFDTADRNGGGIIVQQADDPFSGDHSMRFYVGVNGDIAHNVMTIAPNDTVTINGTTSTKVLRITGGADLAEHLSVTDARPGDEFKIEPGMVVSIDPSGNRKFKLADEPYDRKRVGIISGGNGVQPGLILRDEGNPQADGDQPIALTGQVWCRADTAFGPITPGDLLTTSDTPGHAMKVSDDAKARFAVLGQALTQLREGRGWVQVLVGKQ